MSEMKKLNDEMLENVTGGGERIVTASVARVRSGPGTDYSVIGECCRGDHVYTTGSPVYADGYTWYRLEDSGWIAGELLD
jgi:bacteriocin-like protein